MHYVSESICILNDECSRKNRLKFCGKLSKKFSQTICKSSNNFEKLIKTGINKPARYMGFEQGVKSQNWLTAKVRWALTYPEIYEVGASNLGHIILYSILNKIPGQLCDRAYLPAKDLSKLLREESVPLFAVESKRPLFAFDILGFSLSYELGATNILEMMDLAGINLYSKEREDLPLNDPNSTPLIFAGGPSATSNPEPYASFFDFFALGDGEELLPEIGLIISLGKKLNLKRSSLLHQLSEIPGLSREVIEILDKSKPDTLGQASRITGMTPAAITILRVHLRTLQAV